MYRNEAWIYNLGVSGTKDDGDGDGSVIEAITHKIRLGSLNGEMLLNRH